MVRFLSLALIRFIQLSAVVFYAYIMFIYVGALFLLPLAGIYHLFNTLSFIGLHAFLATLAAITIVAGIIYFGYKIPNFFLIIRDGGLSLVNTGFNQIKQFSQLAEEIKNLPTKSSSDSAQIQQPNNP
jgi:hypothetical protein